MIADQHTRKSTSPLLITTSVSSPPPRGDLPLKSLRPLAEDRCSVGIDLQKEASHDRCLQLSLGSTVWGHTSVRLLVQLAYHLLRDDGGFSCPKILPASLEGAPCPGLLGQLDSGSLYKSPWRCQVTLPFKGWRDTSFYGHSIICPHWGQSTCWADWTRERICCPGTM